MGLMDYLYQEVEKIPGASIWAKYPRESRSAIATILLAKELGVSSEKLLARGVFAHARDGAALGADGMIRVSVHYYNDRSDIDRLCSAIKACAAR
jgi:selenocysteine lyase/cysteine desulfurase